ncbi:MAG: SCO family protein, partial [Anaerolineales bacterium]|nr:SCO family protein [Anaerolineales bacterium]
NGRPVQLGDYFAADRPVVLTLGYYECPRLCGLVFKETADALRGLQGLTVGADFTVLSVSIDPGETPAIAAAKKAAHVSQAGPAAAAAAAGWHFLTGQQAAIDRLADAVGFRYAYDPASDQFAHPTGLIVLTPDGRIARYIFGIDYPPRDLRLALVDAAAGEIGSPADQLLLLCYRYDPQTGRYTPLIASAIRWAGLGTVLLLGLVLGRAWRRE